jgi:acetyl esterase/lipase
MIPEPHRRYFSRFLPIALLATMLTALLSASIAPAGRMFSAIVADGGVDVERGVRFGPGPRDALDIYRPRAATAPNAPVLFFIYGGGWTDGDRATYGFVGAAFAARGITTVIADYRVFPEARFPTFVQDSARAYRWAADTIARGRPIVVAGHSAGAHTAALLAADRSYLAAVRAPPPAALIGLAGPYAFDPTTWPTTKEIFATAPTADAARPIAFAGAHLPPTLLLHGTGDETVKLFNQRDFAAKLGEAGVAVRALELPAVTHTGILLALSRPFRRPGDVLDTITVFLNQTFNAPSSAATGR